MRLTPWLLVLGLIAASHADAETIFGVTTTNDLVRFDSATTSTLLATVPITGLQPGEQVVAIDFRPRTGQLYGLVVNGPAGRLVVIHPGLGTLTQIGSLFTVAGTFFGFDFNPTNDRLRVVSEADINLLINPDTGAVTVQVPVNPGNPNVVAVAYSNNQAGAVSTTLYGVESGVSDALVIINPPASGTLTPVGPLGTSLTNLVGFDISPSGTAYLAATVGDPAQFYTVNLTTGAATQTGAFPVGVLIRGIAVPTPPRILVTGAGPGGGPHVEVFDPAGISLFSFFPFPAAFTGGAHVAACDVNGDGFPDLVTGAGAGGGPHVRVFDGLTGQQLAGPLGSFFAFPAAFTGGVFVGCADLDGDGKGDVIVAAGPGGGPHVRVLSGATGLDLPAPIGSFFPYNPAFTGGVFVGASGP
jgi:hypothetical protein